MRNPVLKALAGKYICATRRLTYCHVHDVIATEENRAIVAAVIRTRDGKTLHWVLEVGWETNAYGEHRMKYMELIKEVELVEYPGYAAQDETVQRHRKGLSPQTGGDDDLQVHRRDGSAN